AIRRLYLYGPWLGKDRLRFKPWGNRSSARVAGYKLATENKTARIPEAISGPLLRWAQFYVDHAIDDIVRHIEARQASSGMKRQGKRDADVRFQEYVDRVRRTGRRIPVMRDGFFDWWAIAADASMSAALLRQRRSTFDELAAELGTVVLPLDDWTHVPDVDLPWRGPVGTWERRYLPIHAIGACYVIVALLSGMRDSEVTDLKRGCLRATLREDGTTKGYEVSGRIYKGDKRRVEGREHTWVVIEPVAKAIGALERLSSCLNELGWHPLGDASDGADLLFWSNASRSERRALTGKQSLDYVRTFVEQCRSSVAYMCRGQSEEKIREIRALYEIPPGDNGLPWRFETRQFRRTLAWYIARQPFGIIAGMLQFGHASAIIFEGYAGQSASGFRDEIAEFELLGQLEDITEDFERWQGGTDPQGPMGKRLKSEFERIEAELGDLPGQVVDEDRRNKMLRNVALTLHPGFI
ncbi:MAG: hypothetical protein ACLGIM_04730, partial [Alphaproteobacteria bacterium]